LATAIADPPLGHLASTLDRALHFFDGGFGRIASGTSEQRIERQSDHLLLRIAVRLGGFLVRAHHHTGVRIVDQSAFARVLEYPEIIEIARIATALGRSHWGKLAHLSAPSSTARCRWINRTRGRGQAPACAR